MTVLVLADHDNKTLGPATARAVTAALQLGAQVHVLVAGEGAQAAAQAAAAVEGVTKVLHAEAAHYGAQLPEEIAPLIARLAPAYSHVLAAATTTGKDILPRASALLEVAQVSEVIKILAPDIFQRPIYAGNALETVQALDAVKCLTIRATAFAAAASAGAAPVEPLAPLPATALSAHVSQELSRSARPALSSARVVVAGGRGLGSAENFRLLERLADKLGAAIGASRAAVDAGYVANDLQVGQTGKVVAPELYIAIGISGAIQHLAGMKDSRVIVAINKDENAPIFELADYGLVGDLFTLLPELEALLP